MEKKVSHLNSPQRSHFRLNELGYVFQDYALFPHLSVLENVMFPILEYTDFSYNTVKELAYQKLVITGLDSVAYNKYPKEISPGMQKRVALARTLALDPKVLFLDEPTSGLDPIARKAVWEHLQLIHQRDGSDQRRTGRPPLRPYTKTRQTAE